MPRMLARWCQQLEALLHCLIRYISEHSGRVPERPKNVQDSKCRWELKTFRGHVTSFPSEEEALTHHTG